MFDREKLKSFRHKELLDCEQVPLLMQAEQALEVPYLRQELSIAGERIERLVRAVKRLSRPHKLRLPDYLLPTDLELDD